jgi:predicted MFS family arabinose efflux permease
LVLNSDFRALAGVSRAKAWVLIVLAMLAMAVSLVDRQVLAAIADIVTRSLGISDGDYGWLGTAFAGAYLVGSLPAARFVEKVGPRIGLAITLAVASGVMALHSFVTGFWSLLALRVAIGLAIAPAFPSATQAIHRVLPYKHRARAIGLLYLGNSLGSAITPPIATTLESHVQWRTTFEMIATLGVAWIPIWMLLAFTGGARETLDNAPIDVSPTPAGGWPEESPSNLAMRTLKVLDPTVFRGSFVVAAAAPVTTVMLLWGSKYLVRDHHLSPNDVGRYLWVPALLFGIGSVAFGELRGRRATRKTRLDPPTVLMSIAALMTLPIALVPLAHDVWPCVLLASVSMAGAGGLYTLATTDMLARTPRGSIPTTTGLTTLTQCGVYMIVNPLIGRAVEYFHSYAWVMVAAGAWVIPGCAYWVVHASLLPQRSRK